MKYKGKRKLLGAGHLFFSREIRDYDSPRVQVCKYSPDCERVCEENKNCQIYKFYKRYPDYYLEMGIGALI